LPGYQCVEALGLRAGQDGRSASLAGGDVPLACKVRSLNMSLQIAASRASVPATKIAAMI
jgi:hypothetical protein